mmetsp:Transcript_22005/g.45877  ORF Transcript_22005/g.45877 Transcript_22005/m.45877 type:complete len:225 (-) Transcript_22005:153-827(-)
MGPQQDHDAGSKSNDNNNSTPLYVRYPVLSVWEFVLNPNQTQVQGTVYCVNVPSQTIWLLPVGVATATESPPPLHDTTELRLIHVKAIAQSKLLQPAPTSPESSKRLQLPTEPVSLKALQDRERRALRQAEESFLHMNDKVSPEGQEVFDRLVKACGQVAWKQNIIVVLNSIQVVPPYLPENVQLWGSNNKKTSSAAAATTGTQQEGLERVQKIVASVDRSAFH